MSPKSPNNDLAGKASIINAQLGNSIVVSVKHDYNAIIFISHPYHNVYGAYIVTSGYTTESPVGTYNSSPAITSISKELIDGSPTYIKIEVNQPVFATVINGLSIVSIS